MQVPNIQIKDIQKQRKPGYNFYKNNLDNILDNILIMQWLAQSIQTFAN